MSYRSIPPFAVLTLAVSCAWANPTGPQVVQGSATVTNAAPVTTVTSTPGTVIQWQTFTVAPGETVRFTNPGVVNQVPAGASISGTVQSPGPVFFLNGGVVASPGGPTIDLAALANSTLKLDALPVSAREGGDNEARAGLLLTGGKTFIIGPDLRSFNRPGTGVVLAPGTAGELGDLRIPFIRVRIAAPPGKPLDVESVVARRPQIGIFNALFLPAQTRVGDATPTAVAVAPAAPKLVPAATKVAPEALVAKVVPDTQKLAPEALARTMPAALHYQPLVLAAFRPMVEDRSRSLSPIPPAPIEDREVAAAPQAPVEDRAVVAMQLIPAPVEDRVLAAAPAAPVEDRVVIAMQLIPAPVEDRVLAAAPTAPVEDRIVVAMQLIPAPVEDRVLAVPPAAPVEDRVVVAMQLIPAPVEERAASPAVAPAAPREALRFEPVQVASAAPVQVIVLASVEPVTAALQRSVEPAVKVEAPQKRTLPRLMTDRRGGLFFM